MEEPLRILLIDDNPDDRALALRAIERELPHARVREVGDQEEFERALADGAFDVVVTDYQLRWNDGLTVLRAIRARFPERPVIMFTNSGSEEIAVEAMKAGLDDYILKSARHYMRLPVAVRAALDRRATERRAAALDQRLRDLLTRVNVGVFRAAPDGRLLEGNRALAHLLGMPAGAALAEVDLRALGLLDEVPPGEAAIEREVALRRADGRRTWVAVSLARGGSPDAPVLDGLVEDVTARKRAEEAARFLAQVGEELAGSLDEEETLARLMRLVVPRLADWCVVDLVGGETPRQLVYGGGNGGQPARDPVEVAPSPSWPGAEAALRTGAAARYQTLSPAAARALRLLCMRAAGPDSAHSSASRQRRTLHRPAIAETAGGGVVPRAALVAPLAAGGRVFGALTLALADAGGAGVADLDLLEDFAGRASLALENARLYREARESIEVRDRFLALAAHELRTPLASMLPSIQIAEQRVERLRAAAADLASAAAEGERGAPGHRDPLEQAQDALRRLHRQTRRLARLVDDLVDVSRIQRGLLELRRAPHDLCAIAREVVEEQRLAEPRRAIVLELPAAPLVAEVDGDRVGQVITNFLTNALKFAPPGAPVVVRLSREDGQARLAVRDEGPGMRPDELDRIWNVYYRARGLEHQSGSGIGLGLGLYISREIITRSGGRIGAESAPGQGSTFWFTFPLSADESA